MSTTQTHLITQLRQTAATLGQEIQEEQARFDTFVNTYGSKEGVKAAEGATNKLAQEYQEELNNPVMVVDVVMNIINIKERYLDTLKKTLEEINNLLGMLNEIA